MASMVMKEQVTFDSSAETDISNACENEAAVQPANNPPRRLACETCRSRKVRCDRRDPSCSRCTKVGIRCHYPSRVKTKTDLSRILLTLDDRLKQAEARLACTPSTRHDPFMSVPVAYVASPTRTLNIATSDEASTPDLIAPENGPERQDGSLDKAATSVSVSDQSQDIIDAIFDTRLYVGSTDLVISDSLADERQAPEIDPLWFDLPSSPLDLPVSTTSPSFMQGFFDRFFEVSHPITPMVNRTRFQSEILQSAPSIEVQLLSYAIALHGAVLVRGLQSLVDKYYDHARNLLDMLERQETGESLANINTLQACILLTAYEFKRPNFARSWMTLGRACRLAKIMGLDKASNSSVTPMQWGLQTQMVRVLTPADAEEGRRAFWTLYVYEAFASLRTNSALTFDKPINVPLPSPHEYPERIGASDRMPTLEELFKLPTAPVLSAFAGTTVMVHVYQQCFEHMQLSLRELQYPFWETHYRIEKAIDRCRSSLLAQHVSGGNDGHPLAIGQRMNLNAVEIALHETALAKVQKDELPSSLAVQAAAKCSLATRDIVEACRCAQRLLGSKLDSLRQVDQFLVWPITMAVQVCFRMLYHGDQENTLYIECLRVLSDAMRNLIDSEHIPPGLLEKADARVAEAEGLIDELWTLNQS